MADSESALLVERDGARLALTINRPQKFNPLSREVLAGIAAALRAPDDTTRCVTITGAGDRYFAAGGDLRDLAGVKSEAQTIEMVEACRGALDAVRECPVPVVAILAGDAIGGGAELACACDFRVMREGTHIGFIHGRLAITAAWGGSADLYGLIGRSRALRMTTRGELIDAQTALAWGLADAVYTDQETIEAFLGPIMKNTPAVLRAFKAQALAARRGASYAERRAVERAGLVQTWTAPEHWAAVDKILAKEKR